MNRKQGAYYSRQVTELTTLTSNQRYEMIGTECLTAIELAKNEKSDKLLAIDCHFLLAVSLYRLHRPLQAVAAFNAGKRIRQRLLDMGLDINGNPANKSKENLDQEYADICLK